MQIGRDKTRRSRQVMKALSGCGTILASAMLAVSPAVAQTGLGLTSPDQRTRLTVSAETGLHYTVDHDGAPVLAESPMGLFTSQGSIGGEAVTVLASEASSVNDSYAPLAGKASRVADRYNQLTLHLQRRKDDVKFDVVLRAYDDGVAFRFVVPGQAKFQNLDVFWETTGFYFPADYGCWGANAGKFENSHETEFSAFKASAMWGYHLYDAPLVCKTGKGQTTFALLEADKRDYAGAYYTRRGDYGLGVNVGLSPRVDNARDTGTFGAAVHASLVEAPLTTPWRVVMIGDRPGKLIESSLVQLLATPSKIADTSWIRPGKSAWDWWNGWAVNVPDAGINTASYKAYIDFAQSMKLDYILIDEGWYKGSSEGARPADVTVPIAAMDMPGIVKYGAERHVGVWVWLQWKQLERQMDAALALYETWGIKGIKVDFMDRNDQQMVAFYHELLSKAAAHHLMVDLHGAYPPDGLARTWPNFLTQEGVLGAEYNKFGTRITATHNVTLPFTRMLLGPMDYTPGGFHALPPAEMARQHRSPRPFVQTTRGQALAMYVVYDSPLVMLADSPDSYIDSAGRLAPGADFVKQVPTSWDETRFLAGEVGDYIVLARRKGDNWYIGAMTNEQARTVRVPLDMLGKGRRWSVRTWQDGAGMNDLRIASTTMASGTSLTLKLAASGGAAVTISPVSGH